VVTLKLKRLLLFVLFVVIVLPLTGCALGVTMLGAGAGMLADRSFDHILTSSVSKTFPVALEEARVATLKSVHEMDLSVENFERTESGYLLTGQTENRRVEIDLEQVSAQATRMRVDVKRNFFWRDRATADAIVAQTESAIAQIKLAGRSPFTNTKYRAQVPTAEILRTANGFSHKSAPPSRPYVPTAEILRASNGFASQPRSSSRMTSVQAEPARPEPFWAQY